MPKKVLKITDFGLGLNNNSDPSSLQDTEIFEGQNIELSSNGMIKMPGQFPAANSFGGAVTSGGIDKNGSVVTWMSDYSKETTVLYVPTSVDVAALVGLWIQNKSTSPDGYGRVVKVASSVTSPGSSTRDAIWVTNETIGTTVSAWPAGAGTGDDIFTSDDGTESGTMTDLGQDYDEMYQGTGMPESNQWIATPNYGDGKVQLYNYNANRWTQDAFDCGSSGAFNASVQVADQVLRVSDIDFHKQDDVGNDTRWYGYISNGMFKQTETGDYVCNEGRWIDAPSDLISWSSIGCTIVWHESTSEMPDDSDVGANAGEKIVLAWWKRKDTSGLYAYVGEFNGEYEFASAPMYENGQIGEIESITSGTVAFDRETLNVQCYVPWGTSDPSTFATTENRWPGFGTTKNKRVTGICVYFKQPATVYWSKLQEFNFLEGDEQGRWTTADAEVEKGYGSYDMTVEEVFPHTDGAGIVEYVIHAADYTAEYTLTSTDGWADQTGFYVVRGWYYDPVYFPITDMVGKSGTVQPIFVMNPAGSLEGQPYQQMVEIHNEQYQQINRSAITVRSFTDGGNLPGGYNNPQSMGCGSGCSVAMTLWGFSDHRTKKSMHYFNCNNNWFTRLYKRYYVKWAKIVERHQWLKFFIKPIFIYTSKKGSKYYNRPLGYPKTIMKINELKDKYPDMFDYYLIGSNARNESITHYYDIQVMPLKGVNYDIWEDILKSLYYIQEDDERFANASISTQFKDIKDYSGEEIYEHQDDIVDCYFYYDPKMLKNYDIRTVEVDELENIQGKLWRHKHPLIGEKWKARGLHRIKYAKREIK